ncbi:MAG: hypothetical protein IID33_06855, partial [Planctomycetes bacterium]|nr:hypothetical protein [Planctomycetota bacterium]
QPQRFAASLANGALLGILMGHSSSEQFSSMRHENRSVGFSVTDARQYFNDAPPAPPIVIFACDAGKFDAEQPCLAEAMLLSRGGPVAVIAATTESHPLTNYYSGFAQLAALDRRQNRLGLMWLDVQRRASVDRNPLIERLLRNVEGKLEDEINVANLRRDQMLMYAVLGDPATRISLPQPLEAAIERTADGWEWTAERPEGATRLSVGFRSAEVLIPASAAVRQADPDAARAAFEAANRQFKYVASATPLGDGPWRGKVDRTGWLRLVATGPGLIHAAVVVAE